MKTLADSWVETALQSTLSSHFHDEVEEHDERDEVEDGCGGVQWHLHVLTAKGTSSKMLHELAREIKGVEAIRWKSLGTAQYKLICDKWEAASKAFTTPGKDYFTELLAKLSCVTVPKGQTLRAAFERAKRREPPCEVVGIRNDGLRLFAALCRELHEMAGGEPIMLLQQAIGKLFGHPDHRNISNWIRALRTLHVLQPAAPARRPGVGTPGRAARYYYIAAGSGLLSE